MRPHCIESPATYFYNIATDTWTRGPDMSRTRRGHTCNLVTHVDGTRDIVIIGGYGDMECPNGNPELDIIHLDSNTSVTGNNGSLLQKSVDN